MALVSRVPSLQSESPASRVDDGFGTGDRPRLSPHSRHPFAKQPFDKFDLFLLLAVLRHRGLNRRHTLLTIVLRSFTWTVHASDNPIWPDIGTLHKTNFSTPISSTHSLGEVFINSPDRFSTIESDLPRRKGIDHEIQN